MVTTMDDTRQLLRETRDRVVPPTRRAGLTRTSASAPTRRSGEQPRRCSGSSWRSRGSAGGSQSVATMQIGPPATNEELGIFAPVAGWIFYANDPGAYGHARIRAVDPASSGGIATTMQVTSADRHARWDGPATARNCSSGDPLSAGPRGSSPSWSCMPTAPRRRSCGGSGTSETPRSLPTAHEWHTCAGNEFEGERPGLYLVDADGGPSVLLAEPGRAGSMSRSSRCSMSRCSRRTGRRSPTWRAMGEWPELENRVWIVNADGSGAHVIVENEVTLEPGVHRGARVVSDGRSDRDGIGTPVRIPAGTRSPASTPSRPTVPGSVS